MKKTFYSAALLLMAALIIPEEMNAQESKGFSKGNMYHQIGMGGQSYWRVGSNSGVVNPFNRRVGRGSNITFQYQGEWGIHDYVGLGFHAGFSVGGFRWRNSTNLYVPLGLQSNFHFYQLIDDKVSGDIKSDKLDIYAGLNFGGGPAFTPSADLVYGGIHGGAHVGARFYPKSNIGIFAELGYGRSFAQFGLVIR